MSSPGIACESHISVSSLPSNSTQVRINADLPSGFVNRSATEVIESMLVTSASPARWMASITSSLACCSVTGESNWTCMSAPVWAEVVRSSTIVPVYP